MPCTNCGSNLPCPCSSQVQTGVGRTCVDPCGVSSNCNPGCCSPSLPASPVPFYACAPSCPESHTQTLVQQQFYFDISAVNTWNIPTCGNTAVLAVPGIKSINIGSYLWDAAFGYFEVTSFDVTTGQITVINNCNTGNASPGTSIPACTLFTVTDPPPPDEPTSQTCVAVDFTAPPACSAAGCCINITVTNLGSVAAGDSVQIGTGRYSVSAIVSSEIITICNDLGLGLIPGTPVIARDSAGNYQYCLTVVASCCSEIMEEFPDGLTPCADFENRSLTGLFTTVDVTGTLTTTDTLDSNSNVITITNPSTCRTMNVLIGIAMNFKNKVLFAAPGTLTETYKIKQDINGGGFIDLYQNSDVLNETDTPVTPVTARQFSYYYTLPVGPGITTVITYKGNITVNFSSMGSSFITGFDIQVGWLGVAV